MRLKKIVTCFLAAAIAAGGAVSGIGSYSVPEIGSVLAAESTAYSSLLESAYVKWNPVNGADGYNVYIKSGSGNFVQLDPMLVRQYGSYFRADAVGLKAGKYVMKVVPVINGKENEAGAYTSDEITVSPHDRSGYGWVGGTSSGAYNEDGTLKNNAVVVYVTDKNKDTVTAKLNAEGKGEVDCTGIQNIILAYKKGKETRPLALRIIGNITDPAVLTKGDLYVDTAKAGMTIEGIGNDATFNGFGLVLKNCSNVEVRNLGFMNCDSDEGDDVGLQQGNDHCWVHNCDFFYGDAGSDADQVKGDGALDTKKSTYITHSYNHFWDNGKCNLQGANDKDTSNFITYHHNWYDHSDSRHPRVRVATVHVYNNYYDGNAKYGVGSTTDSDVFVENNYFRNCKEPMLISKQGSEGGLVLSKETGGMIKAYGNIIVGAEKFVPYSENNTDFDAYVASSRDEKVPSSVKAKEGGATYNNFDTASDMYKYTADKAEDVPARVAADAGRVDGGDFQWKFDNSVDDASYAVNTALKAALVAYKDSIIAVGSGFSSDIQEPPVTEPTQPAQPAETTVSSETETGKPSDVTTPVTTKPISSQKAIYCSPDAKASGAGTMDDPTDVLSAISAVQPGQCILLLKGTYKFDKTIVIDNKNCGTSEKYKGIMAYPGDEVVWDFSALATDPSNRGVVLDGDYWCFSGFEITKAGDNGMLLSGNNNIIFKMVFNDNQDTGLQISRYDSNAEFADWPADNWIVGCTAKNNCDDASMENADGFAAKLTCGNGNVFDNCMSYNNSDDGWDLYAKTGTGPIGVVTIRNCIAFRNGFTEFGEGFGDCDGNGFKLGGAGVGTAHVVENCLAFENLHCGFTDNNNPKLGRLTNCTSYNNGTEGNGKPNISCYRCTDGCAFSKIISYVNHDKLKELCDANEQLTAKVANDKFVGTMEKSVYYNSGYYYVDAKTAIGNGDKIGEKGISLTPSDFISLDVPAYKNLGSGGTGGYDFHKGWRNEEGAIDTNGFLQLKDSSRFKGLGVSFAGVKLPEVMNIDFSEPPVTTPATTSVTEDSSVTASVTETEGTVTSVLVITTASAVSSDDDTTVNITVTKAPETDKTESPESSADPEISSTTAVQITETVPESVTSSEAPKETSVMTVTSISEETSEVDGGSVVTITHIVTVPDTQISNLTTASSATTVKSTTKKPASSSETGTEILPDGKLYGDVNTDGKVNVSDVVALNMYLLNKEKSPVSAEGKANADCKRDNRIDTSDSTLLMNFVAEIIAITDLGKK